jgi:hypothetical protein
MTVPTVLPKMRGRPRRNMDKPKPLAVRYRVTCPDPADLRTGDLVFPRAPDKAAQRSLMWRMLLDEVDALEDAASVERSEGDATVDKSLVGQRLRLTVREAVGPLLKYVESGQPLMPLAASDLPLEASATLLVRQARTARNRTEFDVNNPAHLALLLKILRAEFKEEFRAWLDMTVDEFIRHPISRILIEALSGELESGLFVGHVGMVIEEPAAPGGAAKLMVYEGNVTDFSAYETRAKLYVHPTDPPAEAGRHGRMHGWVGYRHAVGNMVWSARPKLLFDLDENVRNNPGDTASLQKAQAIRAELRRMAKKLTGIGYGFFDDEELGDQGRLYCSEYVRAVLLEVAKDTSLGFPITLADNKTWNWMVEHIDDRRFQKAVLCALHADNHRLWKYVDGEPFFIYTVQMAWRTLDMHMTFTPPGQRPYA